MAFSLSPEAASLRPEVQAFLQEIKSHPEDDTPRLILADWLQEFGTPEEAARGEFIRIQVLRHQMLDSDPRQQGLRDRQNELIRAHLDRWLGPLHDTLVKHRFERGFLELEARAEILLADSVAAFATPDLCAWVESLCLTHMQNRQAARLAASPFLPYVHTLDLDDNRLHHQGLPALVRSPNVASLRVLRLKGNRAGPEGAMALASSRHLARLVTLDLRGNRIRDPGALALAESPHLSNLRELLLRGNGIRERGQEALRARFGERVSFS
jgi:uncharacterized protein (TIGR02996 family)